ncbi:hypothetical protein [Teredinibacter turnerae]|uniref:hypothetical protein n=1 Tax=Teredinibacter turnerae TaxID=2426 RepID=UPI0030CE9026
MATDGSLALWLAIFILLVGGVVFILPDLGEMNKIITGTIALLVWPLTFPAIVKAKKFKQRHYWLPNSRMLGYFVYLLLPVGLVVLALVLAIYFEVGM